MHACMSAHIDQKSTKKKAPVGFGTPMYLSTHARPHTRACTQANLVCTCAYMSAYAQAAFVQLVDAIERRHDPSVKAFYWIDILNCAQCRHNDRAKQLCKDDAGRFAETIAISEAKVWMHCEPWYNPRTFGRVWYAFTTPLFSSASLSLDPTRMK